MKMFCYKSLTDLTAALTVALWMAAAQQAQATTTAHATATALSTITLTNISDTEAAGVKASKKGTYSINTAGSASGFIQDAITNLSPSFSFSAPSGPGSIRLGAFIGSIAANGTLTFILSSTVTADASDVFGASEADAVLSSTFSIENASLSDGAKFTVSFVPNFTGLLSVQGGIGLASIHLTNETTGASINFRIVSGERSFDFVDPSIFLGSLGLGESLDIVTTFEATAKVPEPASLTLWVIPFACLIGLLLTPDSPDGFAIS